MEEKLIVLKRFFESEIEVMTKRLQNVEYGSFFHGVYVGTEKAHKLMEEHVKYCERILELIEK